MHNSLVQRSFDIRIMLHMYGFSHASVGQIAATSYSHTQHATHINPKISAATHLDGQYEYNRAPMAPPGTINITHETPNRRRTWAPHGQDGWYIGPALEIYHCYTVYIKKLEAKEYLRWWNPPPQKYNSLSMQQGTWPLKRQNN
jgi:hypothetical protein